MLTFSELEVACGSLNSNELFMVTLRFMNDLTKVLTPIFQKSY